MSTEGELWLDAEAEGWYDQVYAEGAERARDEFKIERLQSFYRANPRVALPALECLQEAKSLVGASNRGAVMLATTSAELVVKAAILRPLVFGLVHSDSLALLVANSIVESRGVERLRDLLIEILKDVAGVDLKLFKRAEAKTSLWNEITSNQKTRDGVIHRGSSATSDDADFAIAVAEGALKELLPAVLVGVNLHIHDDGLVCGEYHAPPEILERLARLIEDDAQRRPSEN